MRFDAICQTQNKIFSYEDSALGTYFNGFLDFVHKRILYETLFNEFVKDFSP